MRAFCSADKRLSLVCNDARILGFELALPANAISPFRKGYRVVLIVLDPGTWAIDPDVADIKAVRNVVRKTIVTKHRNTVIDCMPVPGRLAFRQNGRTAGPGLDRVSGHGDVGNTFNQQIALRI